MKTIIDYQILTASGSKALERLVMEEMRHNFQPQGGVAVKDGTYAQAMVKYATEKTEKG